MNQPEFDWSAPPMSGRSSQARHASWTGSQAVVETWSARQSAYLQLLQASGALTDHAAAALLAWPLSSVNSVRGALGDRIVSDGFDERRFVDLGGRARVTKRTRWTIR